MRVDAQLAFVLAQLIFRVLLPEKAEDSVVMGKMMVMLGMTEYRPLKYKIASWWKPYKMK